MISDPAPGGGAAARSTSPKQPHAPKKDDFAGQSNSANAHIFGAAATRIRQLEPMAVRIPEAVAFSGLSRSRLFQMMAAGALRRVKHGRVTLIPVADLRALITGTD